jgi:hypothetical protein
MAQVRIVGAISGTVTDPSGAAVPNAEVKLKDAGTGNVRTAAANTDGGFSFPDLSFGTYEITVSAAGFQAVLVPNVAVEASKTTDVPVTLRVGAQTETVTVSAAASPIIETTSQLVSETTSFKEINELPILSRSVLGVARFAPGAQPPESGDTRYNNMPGGAVNVTFDGINNASNGYKSGGTVFYTTVPGRMGAVEEVAVETTGLSADAGAQSGANIKFVTRRGTSQYHWSVFYQPASELFNANSWTRNATRQGFRTRNRMHDFGGNFGGRLLPGTRFKDKVFFFVNFENSWQPAQTSSTQATLLPSAIQGVYTYPIAGTANFGTVNVLQVAAANGYPAALNPVTQSILTREAQSASAGYVTPINGNYDTQTLNWVQANNNNYYFPTTRLDYYINQNLQFTGTWNLEHRWFPGLRDWPTSPLQNPFRIGGYFVWSAGLNWTITPRTFNEFRYGVQHSGDSNQAAKDGYAVYDSYNNAPELISRLPLVSPYIHTAPNVTGRHFITTITDNATMIRGNHNIQMGGAFRETDWKDAAEQFQFPSYTVGVPGTDPLSSIFNSTTMPGAINSDYSNAASLYALLTGRLSGITQTEVINPQTFQYNGSINFTWTRSYMGGVYAQDRWRVTPNFTLNYGLRWEVQGDQYNVNGITAFPDLNNLYGPSVGLFQPGVLSGNNDPLNYTHGHAYKPDWINPAPNLGFAWNPKREEGWLGKLLGGSKTVLRGSYGITVYDEGSQFFAAGVGNNPGKFFTQSAIFGSTAPYGTSLLNVPTGSLPAFPAYTPVFHQAQFTFNNTFIGSNPDLRAPYVINWNFGVQRELKRDLVLEVRYVGNESHHSWRTSTLNEVNIFENGFLQEFKNAQNNLAIVNGITVAQLPTARLTVNNFANQGLPGQVNLPIFQAAFGAIGSTPAVAAGSGFGSTGFITNLQNGAAGTLANSLATSSTYMCHMFGTNFLPCASRLGYNAAGAYPINFFLLNPFSAGSLLYVDDKGWNDYNGLQITLRKRFSRGLTWQGYYTFSKSMTNLPADNAQQTQDWTTLRNEHLDVRPSAFDLRHTFQSVGTYDLPIGKNRLLHLNNHVLDSLIGGWTFGSVLTLRSGLPVKLTTTNPNVTSAFTTVNTNDPGVILAPGVTLGQIQGMMVNTQAANTSRQTLDKRLIGPDGRASTQYFLTPMTPGVWGYQLYLYNKNVFALDASLTKNFKIKERGRLAIWAGSANLLNHPIWGLGSLNVQGTTFGQTGGPTNSARAMQFRGTLSF